MHLHMHLKRKHSTNSIASGLWQMPEFFDIWQPLALRHFHQLSYWLSTGLAPRVRVWMKCGGRGSFPPRVPTATFIILRASYGLRGNRQGSYLSTLILQIARSSYPNSGRSRSPRLRRWLDFWHVTRSVTWPGQPPSGVTGSSCGPRPASVRRSRNDVVELAVLGTSEEGRHLGACVDQRGTIGVAGVAERDFTAAQGRELHTVADRAAVSALVPHRFGQRRRRHTIRKRARHDPQPPADTGEAPRFRRATLAPASALARADCAIICMCRRAEVPTCRLVCPGLGLVYSSACRLRSICRVRWGVSASTVSLSKALP
jgi:hypothetical protein